MSQKDPEYTLDVRTRDEKYRITQDKAGEIRIFRADDALPWMGFGSGFLDDNVYGSKMIISLANEVEQLRELVERYKKATDIVGFNGDCGADSGAPVYRRSPVPESCKNCEGCSDCLTNQKPAAMFDVVFVLPPLDPERVLIAQSIDQHAKLDLSAPLPPLFMAATTRDLGGTCLCGATLPSKTDGDEYVCRNNKCERIWTERPKDHPKMEWVLAVDPHGP